MNSALMVDGAMVKKRRRHHFKQFHIALLMENTGRNTERNEDPPLMRTRISTRTASVWNKMELTGVYESWPKWEQYLK